MIDNTVVDQKSHFSLPFPSLWSVGQVIPPVDYPDPLPFVLINRCRWAEQVVDTVQLHVVLNNSLHVILSSKKTTNDR